MLDGRVGYREGTFREYLGGIHRSFLCWMYALLLFAILAFAYCD